MPLSPIRLKIKRAKVLAGLATGARPLTGPRFVLFRINHTCNMKCQMCASFSDLVPPEYRITAHENMDFDLFKRIVDECVELDVERVSVGGEGEPSLHPRFMEMLQYTKANGLEGTTITNGARLTPENVERLVDMHWDELNVSMNAGNEESHRAVTMTKLWPKVRNGLMHLAELKRERDQRHPLVRQSNTIFNLNYTSIVDMMQFAIDTRADEMTIGLATLDDFPNDGRGRLALDAEQFAEAKRQLAEASKLAKSAPWLSTNVDAFLESIDSESDQMRITESVQLRIPCTVGHWLAVVDPDGAVHPCCQCEGSLGTAAGATTFKDVWSSPEYARFREAARNLPERGRSLDDCTCHSCDFTPANIMYYNKLHPLNRLDERVSPRR